MPTSTIATSLAVVHFSTIDATFRLLQAGKEELAGEQYSMRKN